MSPDGSHEAHTGSPCSRCAQTPRGCQSSALSSSGWGRLYCWEGLAHQEGPGQGTGRQLPGTVSTHGGRVVADREGHEWEWKDVRDRDEAERAELRCSLWGGGQAGPDQATLPVTLGHSPLSFLNCSLRCWSHPEPRQA